MNTSATFYVLNLQSQPAYQQSMLHNIVARLCIKAAAVGKVCVVCNADDVQTFSDYLWGFSDTEFLAHNTHDYTSHINVSTVDTIQTPEQLATLINISNEQPNIPALNVGRVLEFVTPVEENKKLSRERYKYYANLFGGKPTTHTIAV